MRLRIVAALALAAGLIAAPSFAAETPAPAAGAPPAAPAETTGKPAPMTHHRMPVRHGMMSTHHGMMHATAKPDAEHMTIEQLNAMSLQAAKKGVPFSPSTGQK